MTDNPRTTLLHRARRRTAAIVLGTLAGTGLLTIGIAATAQQASDAGGGTTSDQSSGTRSGDTSGSGSDSSSGSSSDGRQSGGVSPGTSSNGSDGGTHSS